MNKNRTITILLFVVSFLSLYSCHSKLPSESNNSVNEHLYSDNSESLTSDAECEFTKIISPYIGLHGDAKNPWDMIIYDNHLYVGGGDYGTNASPKIAYRYDLNTLEWEACGIIPDEQISRYIILDNELYLPGIDPTDDWTCGNFYKLENDEFVTYRTIPGAVHCFDLEIINEQLFAAVAVKDGSFPVMVSNDGGLSFEQIDVIKDDHTYIENERVYSLFALKDTLYAMYGGNIYRYDGKVFRYECSWQNKFAVGYDFNTLISSKVVFKDKVYFTSGYLYSFENVNQLRYISVDNTLVSDILVYENELYILCSESTEDGMYLNSVKRSQDGVEFCVVYEFEYQSPILSFVIDNKNIYFGVGEIGKTNHHNGLILKVEV